MMAMQGLKWNQRCGFHRSWVCVLVIFPALSMLVWLAYCRLHQPMIDARYYVALQTDSLDDLDLTRQATPTFSEPQDVTREIILARAARHLDILSSQRSKFVKMCSILTPINFCAEFARQAGLRVCMEDDECQLENGNRVTTSMTKDSVQDVIRKGLGLFRVELHNATTEFLVENEMRFRPKSFSTFGTSDSKSLKQNFSSFKAWEGSTEKKYPGSTNVNENSELEASFNPKTFFEGGGGHPSSIALEERKVILWYTPTRYWPTVPGLLPLRGCPEFPCMVTTEKKYAKRSAAMIFAADMSPDRPPPRRPDQVFVFQNHEPPIKFWLAGHSQAWISAFNWTMTYRHDSDILRPYGLIRRKRVDEITENGLVDEELAAILKAKTKMVAAMVSNCGANSRRDDYIRELSRYVQVDVYGACGNRKCPRGDDAKCFREISATYKFFLAFESSICEDYITEKFFRFFNMDLVVVARGSNQYYLHAPRETFINTADFESPRTLAERLKFLDSHPEEYTRMLRAKSQYWAMFQDWPIVDKDGRTRFHHYAHDALPVCQICQRLWNLDKYAKTIPDIEDWFKQKMCKRNDEI
ncbi:hypothetical protein EGW08_008252, partial [Elysia chlorotica]